MSTPLIRHADAGQVLNRQCALCPHACLEFEWLCSCCATLDRATLDHPRNARCIGARSDVRIYGPLLPPHVPEHVWAALVSTALERRGPRS